VDVLRAQADDPGGTRQNPQANFVRTAKFPCAETDSKLSDSSPGYRTRDWSLFFFFRIMSQRELDATQHRLDAYVNGDDPRPQAQAETGASQDWVKSTKPSQADTMKLDLAYPNLLNARLDEGEALPPDLRPAPARSFRRWLRVLADPTYRLRAKPPQPTGISATDNVHTPPPPLSPEELGEMIEKSRKAMAFKNLDILLAALERYSEILAYLQQPEKYEAMLGRVYDSLFEPAIPGGGEALLRMTFYELLRQAAPAFLETKVMRVIRSEEEEKRDRRPDNELCFDRTPINMAFSFSGLDALKLDPATLASFPDVFKEGMAARAQRLGDSGASAPENWEGELGLKSVHGYFTGGFNLAKGKRVPESFWRALRGDIRAFNDPRDEKDTGLRAVMGLLFRWCGMEIVHIELGQDPYDVTGEFAVRREHREEHFGFRDGLSQPFLDLKLRDVLPGGGTASRRGTWAPIAPGEIFLDKPDESGVGHVSPANSLLRAGSTYLVFRKLEQDVYGFRSFLRQQRPGSSKDRERLAAEFVGRWKNGTPLVTSPEGERSISPEAEASLNDFRYRADDPYGRKCPLGAHIRRANPRDTGGRNDVRHHRILRRGLSYGGKMLGDEEGDDGTKRGLLFICANARIDLQFEVIQADWINGGEFLGQAGLGRCPLTGNNDGGVSARFLETGAAAPVTGIPSFVTTRGGDYFFAPGPGPLTAIARGKPLAPDTPLPFNGRSMADAATPALFAEDRIERFWAAMKGGKPVVRVKVPPIAPSSSAETVAFVGCHRHVRKVLEDNASFSVNHFSEAGRLISRGQDFLVGLDFDSKARLHFFRMLDSAWLTLGFAHLGKTREELASMSAEERENAKGPAFAAATAAVRNVAKLRLEAALRRTAGARHIDLVDDLAVSAAYGVVDEIYGIAAPRWLTELAISLPFSRQHVGDLPPDWIAAMRGEMPSDPGLTTMQIWMTAVAAALLGNIKNQQTVQVLGRQAGSEALNHIDMILVEALAGGGRPGSLVQAFVGNLTSPAYFAAMHAYYAGPGAPPPANPKRPEWIGQYLKDVAIILLEILGSTLTIIPLTFASAMTAILKFRLNLPSLLPRLDEDGVSLLIHECERLFPNTPVRMRQCRIATELEAGPGQAAVTADNRIEKDDAVATLIAMANLDEDVFPDAPSFSLKPSDALSPGEPRDLKNYLLFGVDKEIDQSEGQKAKRCWGRDYVALPILQECVQAAGRLQGLRRIAGQQGEARQLLNVTISLPARFRRILAVEPRP